jgi:hypothetical protein
MPTFREASLDSYTGSSYQFVGVLRVILLLAAISHYQDPALTPGSRVDSI